MSIMLIVLIVIAVSSIGIKLHRGSFFPWSNKKDAPNAHTDDRGGHDFG
jgi:hypothetical protein